MGEQNVTEDCIRYQEKSVAVVFIFCRSSGTFDIGTGPDSVILRVASRLKKTTDEQLLYAALY